MNILHLHFVRFQFKIELPQEFLGKTEQKRPLLSYECSNCVIVYFEKKNCAISPMRNRDQRIPKVSEKGKLQRHLSSNFHQKLTDINFCLDNTNHKFSLNSVDQFLSYTCHKFFVIHSQTDTQTDRQFPEIFKLYSGHPKIHQKLEIGIFHETNTFFYLYRRK